jgi:hypothetical protein
MLNYRGGDALIGLCNEKELSDTIRIDIVPVGCDDNTLSMCAAVSVLAAHILPV